MYLERKKLSSDLSDDEINILSNGSISADSFFYKSIGFNANRLELAIKNMINETKSDFYLPNFIKQGDEIIGFFFAYPTEELQYRELVSLKSIIHFSKRDLAIKKKLREIANLKPNITRENCLYLSRIYVNSDIRNSGVGSFMIKQLKEISIELCLPFVSLHCHSSNKRALKFYTNQGFKVVNKIDKGYFYLESKRL